ncbi:MAG: hypothetical protein U1F43_32735 [Myxococcota bacterium]
MSKSGSLESRSAPAGAGALVGALALVLLLVGGAAREAHAAAPEPRPAEGPGPRGRDGDGPGHRSGREGPEAGDRRDRRDIEGGGGSQELRSQSELTTEEPQLQLAWDAGGCGIDHHPKLVKALLGLENQSDLMSLEIWGDTHEYTPYQRVYYYMRVPRTAYVTLFWIGPKQDIFVPFQMLKIPADRDVRVDPDSIVVPPLGREQWVAVATLEPLPIDCLVPEGEHVAWVDKLRKIPHGVGRWEVHSKPGR